MRLSEDHRDRILITPLINEDEQISKYGTIDLRLGREFETTILSSHRYTSPVKIDHDRRPARTYLTKMIDPYVLHTQEFVKAKTLEYVKLPNDVGARLSGRSSYAREGLMVHITADLIHPGSSNFIVLEMRNDGSVPLELYAGLRIAQLTFFQLGRGRTENDDDRNSGKEEGGYSSEESSKFTSIDTPYTGRIGDDVEAKILRRARNKSDLS
ncbi:MAG: dCTP deaminase [Thermoleophilia bacterium]|jgi:dCTP deaminase